jgi:DNA polymerase-3 subunit gamma/tau
MLIIRLTHAALMPTPGDILQKLPTAPTTPNTPLSPTTPPQSTSAESSTNGKRPNKAPATETSPADRSESHTFGQPEMPQSLIDIVTLAEANNEMLLAARIRNHVRLVGLQQGRLEIALAGKAPDTLAGDLAKQLGHWTGQRWLVSLSDKDEAKPLLKTLAEDATEAAAKVHDAIAMDPLVTKIMEVFPGATIDAITPATNPETDPQHADDTASVDDEEMSG